MQGVKNYTKNTQTPFLLGRKKYLTQMILVAQKRKIQIVENATKTAIKNKKTEKSLWTAELFFLNRA